MSSTEFEERVVTVPLRAVSRKPNTAAADVAMREVRDHLAQHFSVDADAVRLDPSINEAVWAGGRANPPSKLRVRAARFEEEGAGVVEAELAE